MSYNSRDYNIRTYFDKKYKECIQKPYSAGNIIAKVGLI